jgi:SPP1 gp7 family putative phage head morphogenesis protein
MSQLATYTGQRLIKAARSRTLDATFSRATGTLSGFARRGFSLLQGIERPGWAIGVDGYTARMLDGGIAETLGLLSTNEIVYACMRERMKVLIQPAFVVERRQADGSYVVDDRHPLSALIRRPGPNLDTATLWRTFEASYASIGRLYIEPVYASRPRMLVGLNPLNPAYIVEVYDNEGRIIAYDWQPPESSPIRFAPDELIVRRAVDWADVPPLIAALGPVEADQLSNDFVRGFFAGGGVPSGIIKARGSWSVEKAGEFITRWTERFTAGTRIPAILDENIESYTRVGVSLNELDNETLRTFIETRICMCFGVPPLIIYSYAGLLRAIESNLDAAWDSYWDATALPLLTEWADWINWSLLTAYEDADDVLLGNVRCRFDVTGIGPFAEDTDGKITLYREAYEAGAVTMNELRTVMGLDEHPDGDVFKAPPQPPMPYITLPPDAGPPANPEGVTSAAEGEALAQEQAEAKAASIVRSHKAIEPPQRLTADVSKYLRDQYAKARRLWLSGNDAGHQAVIREIEDVLDDGITLFGLLAPAERKAYADSWKTAAARVDYDAVIDSGDVGTAVDDLAARCVGITDTTKKEIAELIVKGAQEQQSDSEIAAALAELGFTRSKERAPMIVRTELSTASVAAAVDAYQASGVVSELEWLTGGDPCPDCAALDGKRIALDAEVMVPAHPGCRCDVVPILAEVMA